MKQNISEETHSTFIKNKKNPLEEMTSNQLLQKIEKALNEVGETETKEEEKGKQTHKKIWRFLYTTADIEGCISVNKDSDESLPFKDYCRYILNNSKENELLVCLLHPQPSIWFKQFHFIKQDTLKTVQEGRSFNFNAQGAVRDLGPSYTILYSAEKNEKNEKKEKNDKKNNSKTDLEPSQDGNTNKSRQNGKHNGHNGDEEEYEDEVMSGTQDPNPNKTKISHPQKKADEVQGPSREAVLKWYSRIFRGERVSKIREELGKQGDLELIEAFLKNLKHLKKIQNDPDLFDERREELLRKREYERRYRRDEEEDDEEEDIRDKQKKLLIKEDKEKGKKVISLDKPKEKSLDKPKEKALDKTKEKKKKPVREGDQTEHDLLANSVSFYKVADHFKKTIASLPLFKKELAAFEATLTPKEVKIIEDAIETGFNPIHYIYQYKIGEKTLANIKGGIYKKVLNTPSIEIIYNYIVNHLQKEKKKVEKVEQESDLSQEEKSNS